MISTGIEWLPQIHDGWGVARVKDLFVMAKDKVTEDNPIILSLARNGVKVRDISGNDGQLAESYDNYSKVLPGDLLLNPMDLVSGANCNMSEISGVISPAYSKLRAKNGISLNPKYFDYYFKTQYWSMSMFAHGKGVSYDHRWTINADTLLNYEVPLPNVSIQNKIVSILDTKLHKIDELLDNEKQQIICYQKYRQSLLSKVVEDLKQEGCTRVPLKFLVDLNRRSLPENTDSDFVFNYVEIGSVTFEDGIKSKEEVSFGLAPSRARRIANKGDVIVSTVRTYLKAIAKINEDGLVVSTGFAVLTPKKINPGFLSFMLLSDDFTDAVSANSYGISYPAITSSQLENLSIYLPNEERQKQIVQELNNSFQSINELIKLKNDVTDMIEKYKRSLIYEYVIGKRS